MLIDSTLISLILIIYLLIYMITHLPFDIYMMLKEERAKYPCPENLSTVEIISITFPSLIFWIYLLFIPIISLTKNKDLYTSIILPSMIRNILQIAGLVLLIYGLIVGSLGRISRGAYLRKEKAELVTSGGHALARHPQYLFYITGFIGLPLLTVSFWLIILWPGLYGYYKGSIKEEQVLIEQFGQEYLDYRRNVGRFFPNLKK